MIGDPRLREDDEKNREDDEKNRGDDERIAGLTSRVSEPKATRLNESCWRKRGNLVDSSMLLSRAVCVARGRLPPF